MRFNSPEEVKATAQKNALEIIRFHKDKGKDLNPYSTPGAREDFRRGFVNAPPRSWESQTRDFDYRFQLGFAVAQLINK